MRLRLYTKRVPPERLYFSERNRHGRRRLLKLGRWQLWLASKTTTLPLGTVTSSDAAHVRWETFEVPPYLEPYVEPYRGEGSVAPWTPPTAPRHLRVVEDDE